MIDQINFSYYKNILLPNFKTIFPYNNIDNALKELESKKHLLIAIFPVYKHHWINSTIKKTKDNHIYLSYQEKENKNDSIIFIQNFKYMKITNINFSKDKKLTNSEDSKEFKEFKEYTYEIKNNNDTYTIDWNAYSLILLKNLKNIHIYDFNMDISRGIIIDACRYGYLSSENKNNYTNNDKSLYTFSTISLKSLEPSVQYDILNLFLNRSNCVLTGTTGVGKTSQVPKLLWWFNNLLDGYPYFTVSRNINEKPIFNPKVIFNTTLLSLPRKVLIDSNSSSMRKSLGFQKSEGSPVIIKYKDADKSNEYNSKSNTKSPLLLIVNQLTLNYLNNNMCNTIIIDEIHEHDPYSIIIISIIYKLMKGIRNLVLMTATLEDDLPRIKEYFKNIIFIHIRGDTLYNIKTRLTPILNYTDIIDRCIKNKEFNLKESIIIFKKSKNEVNNLKILLEDYYLQKGNKYNCKIYVAYSGLPSLYDDIKELETNDKRNIIIGTPILESSITINNAKIVIDNCEFYMKYFRSGKTSLITKSMQTQRKGRVGRTSPGIYITSHIINESIYRKIDNEYLWVYLIYCLKYSLNFKDLYIIPKDLTRFSRSLMYLEIKGIPIRKEINKYFQIFTTYSITQIEYLKIYALNLKNINFALFDEMQTTESLTENIKNLIIHVCNMKLKIKKMEEVQKKGDILYKYTFQFRNEIEQSEDNTILMTFPKSLSKDEYSNIYFIGNQIIEQRY